jgi:hypothetical protein
LILNLSPTKEEKKEGREGGKEGERERGREGKRERGKEGGREGRKEGASTWFPEKQRCHDSQHHLLKTAPQIC